MKRLACAPNRTLSPCRLHVLSLSYIDLIIVKAEFQVFVDSFVRNLAQQGQIRNANLLLLGAFKGGLLDLGLPARLTTITHIGDRFGAAKATLLLAAGGAS